MTFHGARLNTPTKQRGGGIRGDITRFSYSSRRRMLSRMGELKKDSPSLFVTLTFPDTFEGEASPEMWRVYFRRFVERMRRRYPEVGYLWRLEVEPRKSGKNKGVFMPHYHMLLMSNEKMSMNSLENFMSQAWYESVRSGDERHLDKGVYIRKPKNFRHCLGYVSKAMGRVGRDAGYTGFRWWGIINSALLPWARKVKVRITQADYYQIRRLIWRKLGTRIKRNLPSITLYGDTEWWLERLPDILGMALPHQKGKLRSPLFGVTDYV